jgi:hypothetical protein
LIYGVGWAKVTVPKDLASYVVRCVHVWMYFFYSRSAGDSMSDHSSMHSRPRWSSSCPTLTPRDDVQNEAMLSLMNDNGPLDGDLLLYSELRLIYGRLWKAFYSVPFEALLCVLVLSGKQQVRGKPRTTPHWCTIRGQQATKGRKSNRQADRTGGEAR